MGMSRRQFLGEIANHTPVKESLLDCYESEEKENWREDLGNSPHGSPWATSFHASAFPGDDDSVCGRAQVYELMNPAPEKPLEPWLRVMFELGNSIEHMHVKRFAKQGILLSNDVTGNDDFQTVFEDKDIWLSGSPDAIILSKFHKKSHIVEIKSTSHEKIISMENDPGYFINSHKKYMRQLKTYIGLAHEIPFSPTVVICRVSGTIIKGDNCNINHIGECDPTLIVVEPPDDGTLIYCSREEPLKTVSFYCSLDLDFLKSGKEKLKQWKDQFAKDELPEHIHEGQSAKWSVGQCQYCPIKRRCKVDFKEKRKLLSESDVIDFTKSVRPRYSYKDARKSVFSRWGVEDPLVHQEGGAESVGTD